MTLILGYCIPRWITMLKLSIFPYFHPQNCHERGINRRFQAKCTKYLNFCIIRTTNVIPTKFCTVIKTTKFSLSVVPKFSPQIKNGGRPPWINCYISAMVRLIWMKFCKLTYIGPLNPKNVQILILKNPRWRMAAILKFEKL